MLFEDAMFDPAGEPTADGLDAQKRRAAVAVTDIDALVSLDTDRVLRAFASRSGRHPHQLLRHRARSSGACEMCLPVKPNPELINELPLPRPKFEIFVYSPRVEGVAPVVRPVAAAACAGRTAARTSAPKSWAWSRRRRSRTPSSSGRRQGRPSSSSPHPTGDPPPRPRGPSSRRGSRLLPVVRRRTADVTDNVDTGHRRHRSAGWCRASRRRRRLPGGRRRQGHRDVLRHRQRRRELLRVWLATFAPGGRWAMTTKAMGITAKGAWESVKRHFREMGDEVRGTSPSSGRRHERRRVRQRHAALRAHPADRGLRPPPHLRRPRTPMRSPSFERRRLFELPRSSWEDYDATADQRRAAASSAASRSRSRSARRCTRALGIDETSPR